MSLTLNYRKRFLRIDSHDIIKVVVAGRKLDEGDRETGKS